MKSDGKIEWLVNKTLDKESGGKTFFDALDKEIRKESNLDLVIGLFERIKKECGDRFNLVVSGNFGDWIFYLIKKGKIKINGNFLQLSGSITSHEGTLHKVKRNKTVSIIRSKFDISNQAFVFLDDSYYSGTTNKVIDDFLRQYNSRIIRTYVIYDGNDEKSKNRIALYSYYDHHKGTQLPFYKLLNHLYSFKNIPHDLIESKIVKGEITTLREVNLLIDKFLKSTNAQGIDIYQWSHRNESKQYIKKFKEFYEK